MVKLILLVPMISIILLGCASNAPADRVTLGTVQQHIHKGISGAEVQEALGSPNIVSKNSRSLPFPNRYYISRNFEDYRGKRESSRLHPSRIKNLSSAPHLQNHLYVI